MHCCGPKLLATQGRPAFAMSWACELPERSFPQCSRPSSVCFSLCDRLLLSRFVCFCMFVCLLGLLGPRVIVRRVDALATRCSQVARPAMTSLPSFPDSFALFQRSHSVQCPYGPCELTPGQVFAGQEGLGRPNAVLVAGRLLCRGDRAIGSGCHRLVAHVPHRSC